MRAQDDTIRARFGGSLGAFTLDVAFEAPTRGITALYGPSGCGKTTILRCIAGLQRLSGHFSIGGNSWQSDEAGIFRKPHERPVGYIFQDATLFPHLSVRKNLLYGARRAARNGTPQTIAEDEIIALLGIGHLLDRAPHALSGGEKQRVSVGRALLSQPRLLLMDEPLSALDQTTKEEILPYFEVLHEHLSIPILYVSHEIREIERLADRLVVLREGRVVTSGTLAEIEADPRSPALRIAGLAVTLEGRVSGFDETYGLTAMAVPGGTLFVTGRHGEAGAIRRLRILASDVSLSLSAPCDSTVLNSLPGRIVTLDDPNAMAATVDVWAALGEAGSGPHVAARIPRKACALLDLKPGMPVFLQIRSVTLV